MPSDTEQTTEGEYKTVGKEIARVDEKEPPKKEKVQNAAIAKAKTTDELPILDAVNLLMKSGLVKSTEGAGQLMAKLNLGRQLGLADIVAINGVQIGPNQTVILSAQLMGLLINRSGKYRKVVRQRDLKGAAIEIFEFDKATGEWISCGVPITFGPDDAKRAGLDKKDNFVKWPVDMFYARALAAAFRVYCPDCAGVAAYLPEEIDGTGMQTDVVTGEMVEEVKPLRKATTKSEPESEPNGDSLIDRPTMLELAKLFKTVGADRKPFYSLYGVTDLDQLTVNQAAKMKRELLQRKAATVGG